MKHPIRNVLVLLCILTASITKAQNPTGTKPSLFNNYPAAINCAEQQISSVFNTGVDQNVSLSFSDNFTFSGKVISNVVKYNNLQTAVIQSSTFSDAIFVVSKLLNADRSTSYIGRIVNKKYVDGYELRKDASNNYQLIKIETDKVIEDCSHK